MLLIIYNIYYTSPSRILQLKHFVKILVMSHGWLSNKYKRLKSELANNNKSKVF